MKTLKEAFEWINLAEKGKIPKDRLLKVVAKTPATTIHPEDPNYPIRIFAEAQLMRNAASLVGRPVGLDHAKYPIYGAYVIDSEWNDIEKQLEALLLVPPSYVKKVENGNIKRSSIEYTWRSTKKSKEGTGKEFVGLSINRIDLLEKLNPGDSDSVVKLFEGKKRVGTMLAEVTLSKLKEGCVWATKWDSPEACIAANSGKEDPEAYCMAKVEGKEQAEVPTTKETCEAAGGTWNEETKTCALPAKEQDGVPTTKEDCEAAGGTWNEEAKSCTLPAKEQEEPETKETCEAKGGKWDEETKTCTLPVEPTAEEMKEALQRVSKELRKLKENTQKIIDGAVKKAREEVMVAVEAVIPKNFILNQSTRSLYRLSQEVKKVLRECRGE